MSHSLLGYLGEHKPDLERRAYLKVGRGRFAFHTTDSPVHLCQNATHLNLEGRF